VQVVRLPQKPDQLLWDEALPNAAKNIDGFVVCQDKRAMKDGWGHVSAARLIVVGEHLCSVDGRIYARTMKELICIGASR